MKIISTLLIGCFLCTCWNVSAQKEKRKEKKNKQKSEVVVLSQKEQYKNTAQFIEAVKERLLGNYGVAEQLLQEVLRTEPTHDAAHFEYANILIAKHQLQDAIVHVQTAIQLNDTNIWYKIMLGDIYNMTENYTESEKLWKTISEKHPENIEYLYNYALSLIYQNKLKEAVKIYDKIEILTGINEDIIYAKQNIWLHLKDIDRAVKELEKLIEAYPKEAKNYLQIADLYNTNNMSDKAIPYIEKAKTIDPTNPEIHIILYNYYLSNKKNEEAFEELKQVFAAPSLKLDEKVKIIMRYFPLVNKNPEYKKEAFILLDTLTKTHPQEAMTWSVYGDFLSQDNRLEEAAAAFEKVLSFDQSKYVVWEQYLSILVDINQWDKAYTESKTAMELFPNQALPYLIHGMMATYKEEWETAVQSLNEGKKYVVDNINMALQFYYHLAEAYYTLQDYKKSDEYFEKYILQNANNPIVLNNYSYYLSQRGERLDYALTLSERANKLSPNEAVYEDTYAWILYKKGEVEKAKEWMEKAIKHGGDTDPDILEHYGDILMKLGESNQALLYWNKAKELGKDHPQLLEKIKAAKQE
ncbi:MAG: tetratricopeptide repeat protein [Bacteroidales bacterium]|jgi:tetratricopeptide (TPR) repeat protein|nr:tetratricopeptide repeat protein [Bacteroidales bacterium]MDD2687208.1 tetratricopeptide repeat protein [Bacteroidales bacterium]MDD3331264.1 tetratricopeptide repeat protein [Bacteroidales bacterium]MDD3691111.1 tetratricopeptide repeat protein [Bacteroidales bacterium]MDD4044785.1 tetratricopeptide repeat protein [Bacteroidales bacterium]